MQTSMGLIGLIGWSVVMTVALVVARLKVLNDTEKAPNSFSADGKDLPEYGYRFTRAHMNSLEYLAIPVGLLLYALYSQQTHITDGLALWCVVARMCQSTVHMISISKNMVYARAGFFFLQVGIWIFWCIRLWPQG